MGEVIRNVMHNVGDGLNGGEEMIIVVPLINEFVINTHSGYIRGLKKISFNRELDYMEFSFYANRYVGNSLICSLIDSIMISNDLYHSKQVFKDSFFLF